MIVWISICEECIKNKKCSFRSTCEANEKKALTLNYEIVNFPIRYTVLCSEREKRNE